VKALQEIRLPTGFKRRLRGSCVPAAITLLPQLTRGDYVVEGYVILANGNEDQHTWMEVCGIVYDPTSVQYRTPITTYKISQRFTPEQYRRQWAKARSLWWDNRVKSFGGRP
jgi:hypothetical protein